MDLFDVMTIPEAATRWGVGASTLVYSCLGRNGNPPRFRADEFRRSGTTWLISAAGMERLYGIEKKIKL